LNNKKRADPFRPFSFVFAPYFNISALPYNLPIAAAKTAGRRQNERHTSN